MCYNKWIQNPYTWSFEVMKQNHNTLKDFDDFQRDEPLQADRYLPSPLRIKDVCRLPHTLTDRQPARVHVLAEPIIPRRIAIRILL